MRRPGLRGGGASTNRARLLLVDDHSMAREGLRAMLHSRSEFEVVAEAASADEAIQHVRQLQPDLALIDVHLPGIDGISLTHRLKGESYSPRVLITTVDPSPARLLAGLRAGADGSVLKGSSRALLIRAIREALRGGPLLAPEVAAYLLEMLTSNSDGVFTEPLTQMEAGVLRLSAAGCTRRQIAQALALRPREVSAQVHQVLDKLLVPPSTT